MTVPRIAPGRRRDVGWPIWIFSTVAGRVAGTPAPNLFLTLGRHRRLFWGWIRFASRLMPGGKLPRRETELVILRVAHLRGCDYEFEHHRRLGKRAGVTSADVERVREGQAATEWTRRERLLLAAVDALHQRNDMDDATWKDLRDELGDIAAIELVMLVGHYQMLATAVTTLRIAVDEPRSRRRA